MGDGGRVNQLKPKPNCLDPTTGQGRWFIGINVQSKCKTYLTNRIDYTEADFSQTPERYDLILAANGSQSLFTYRRLLAKRGTCVILGGELSQVFSAMAFGWLLSMGGKRMQMLSAKASAADLEFVINLVAQGKVVPVIDRTYALAQAPEAFDYISRGHALGKVVVSVVDG